MKTLVNKTRLVTTLAFLLPLPTLSQTDPAQLVNNFMAAYNDHDIELMLTYLSDDFRWLSSADGAITVETAGKEQLSRALTSYFESLPSARSATSGLRVDGSKVSVVEEASWGSGDSRRSQCARAVYEVAGGKLTSVTYFNVQPCE